jgi:hypothetical protein
MRVTPGIFEVLGRGAEVGRVFQPAEQDPGVNRIVILTDALWRRWFNASNEVLGQSMRLDDERYVIVGVMPPDFRIDQLDGEELYVPLPIEAPGGHVVDHRNGRRRCPVGIREFASRELSSTASSPTIPPPSRR